MVKPIISSNNMRADTKYTAGEDLGRKLNILSSFSHASTTSTDGVSVYKNKYKGNIPRVILKNWTIAQTMPALPTVFRLKVALSDGI